MLYDEFLENVDRGKNGMNIAIPIGLPRLQREMYGIQKRIYTLIIGMTGSGKTSLVDCCYVINAYRWWVKNRDKTPIKFRIIYRSMERSTTYKIAKLTSLLLFLDYGYVLDVADIFYWEGEKSKMNAHPGVYDKLLEYRKFFEEMFDYVEIIDGAENPTGVHRHIQRFYSTRGELFTAGEVDIKLNGRIVKQITGNNFIIEKDGEKKYFEEITVKGITKKIFQYRRIFFTYDENLILLHITDHAGKIKKEKGMNNKQVIDKHSEYMADDRDVYGMSPLDVFQLNRELSDPQRLKMGDVAPRLEDIKDTGNPSENADLVIATFDPSRYGIKSHLKYDLTQCISKEGHNRFRPLHILKNSWGADGLGIGGGFDGRIGLYIELKEKMELRDYYDLTM